MRCTSGAARRSFCAVETALPLLMMMSMSAHCPAVSASGLSSTEKHRLQCALSALAFEFGAAKGPSINAPALYDSLGLAGCPDAPVRPVRAPMASLLPPTKLGPVPNLEVFVAANGSDHNGAGTQVHEKDIVIASHSLLRLRLTNRRSHSRHCFELQLQYVPHLAAALVGPTHSTILAVIYPTLSVRVMTSITTNVRLSCRSECRSRDVRSEPNSEA